MSPRRSSRARTTQPPSAPAHTNSSTSSNSMTRADRNNRVTQILQSPRRSSTQRSESQDDADSTSRAEAQAPRRSRRGTDVEEKAPLKDGEEDEDGDEPEEEVTRCICGQPEYPGPPAWIREQLQQDQSLSDDIGNFFVQCDNCQVWQHGGCMGFTEESQLPEQYYCEQCKPESHRIIRDANGSKSSRYLPVLEISISRSSSLSASEPSRKDSKGRNLSEASVHAKRRATMNSRTALDDDELLRQAIEESKEMGTLGKRTRDDSEDNKLTTKRQRTHSSSVPSPPNRSRSPSQGASDNERPGTGSGSIGTRKIRGAAARNQREKELREKQKERELAANQRAEAAKKREARSERRRGEDSPPPTPSLSPSKGSGQPTKDTPPPPKSNISNLRNSHKAGASRSHARRGRLGRNQYSRDLPNDYVSDTPGRDDSHDPPGEGSPSAVNGTINGESGKSSRAKTHGAKTTMNEMKRRVAAILEFVGRMQGEGQTQGGPSRSSDASGGTPNGSAVPLPTASLVQAVEKAMGDVQQGLNGEGLLVKEDGKAFTEMASGEMMEMLTRELIGWQNVYGRHGEKS